MGFLDYRPRGRERLSSLPLYCILILLATLIVVLGAPVDVHAERSSPAALARVDSSLSDESFKSASSASVGSEPSSGASSPRSWDREDRSGSGHYEADVSSATTSPDAARSFKSQAALAMKGVKGAGTYEDPLIPLAAHPLDNGAPDLYLQQPANQHIRDAIAQLPQSRDHSLLVSMADKLDPLGYRLYKFYNEPYAAIHRERVPTGLHGVEDMEDGAGSLSREAEQVQTDQQGHVVQLRQPGGRGAWFKSKLDAALWKLRTHLSDLKDTIAVGRDRSLANYHTTGGIPAFYGRNDILLGYTVPVDARRVAQERGEVRIFYDPLRPQNQVRLTYHGELRKPGDALAPEDDPNWHAYKTAEHRALPLPKHWRDTNVDEATKIRWAQGRMTDSENGDWTWSGTRNRWPDKWDAQRAKWRAKWEAGRQNLYNAPNRLRNWNRSRPSAAQVVAGWRTNLVSLPNRVQNWYRSGRQTEGAPAGACAGGVCDLQSGRASRPSDWKSTLTTAWSKVSSPFTRRPATAPSAPAADPQDAALSASRPPSWAQAAAQKFKTAKDRFAALVPFNRTPTTTTIVEQAGDAVSHVHRR